MKKNNAYPRRKGSVKPAGAAHRFNFVASRNKVGYRSQRIMIHYRFIGYIEIPECRSNYKADTRKGVAVEYITQSA